MSRKDDSLIRVEVDGNTIIKDVINDKNNVLMSLYSIIINNSIRKLSIK